MAPFYGVSTILIAYLSDAPDFFESSFWSDSSATSGLGGWGQASLNNDYAVPTGAFDTWYLSYPSPHILRRNFTEQPWLSFAGNPFFPDPAQIANSSFTASEVQKVITGFEGDFKNMQKYVEQTQVCLILAVLLKLEGMQLFILYG